MEFIMNDIIKSIVINISVIASIALFFKKRFEKYVDSKINHHMAKALESYKMELQKELEIFKENLYSAKPLKDDFVQRNKELMDNLGDIRTSIQFLIKTHAEKKQINKAWKTFFAKIPNFEDFIVRYKSPYFLHYDNDIKNLTNTLNDIIKSIDDVRRGSNKTYNIDFQKVITIIDKLKEKVYSNITNVENSPLAPNYESKRKG